MGERLLVVRGGLVFLVEEREGRIAVGQSSWKGGLEGGTGRGRRGEGEGHSHDDLSYWDGLNCI